jgi:hypothetical protein
MATQTELEKRCDLLTQQLRDRDAADALAATTKLAAEQAAADALNVGEQAAAAAVHRETVRTGAWFAHFIGAADPASPVDYDAISEAIPSEADKWPPGKSPADYALGVIVKTTADKEVSSTRLGRALTALR